MPIQTERYFLLCEERALESPGVATLLEIVRSGEFKAAVNALPGYKIDETTGRVAHLESTFSSLGTKAERSTVALIRTYPP